MHSCLVDIASSNHCSQLIFHHSRTLRHVCMYVCRPLLCECVLVRISWWGKRRQTADGRRQRDGGGLPRLPPRSWLLCPGAPSPLPHDHSQRSRSEQSDRPIRDRHTQWERDLEMIPPTTHRHSCRGTWQTWTHRHATAGYIVHW